MYATHQDVAHQAIDWTVGAQPLGNLLGAWVARHGGVLIGWADGRAINGRSSRLDRIDAWAIGELDLGHDYAAINAHDLEILLRT